MKYKFQPRTLSIDCIPGTVHCTVQELLPGSILESETAIKAAIARGETTVRKWLKRPGGKQRKNCRQGYK